MNVKELYLGFYLEEDQTDMSEIFQGDIFFDIPDVYYPYEIPDAKGIITLSNTCDIKNQNISNLQVCPFYPFQRYIDGILVEINNPTLPLTSKTKKTDFVKKISPIMNFGKKGAFLIPPHKSLNEEIYWANLEQLFYVPFSLKEDLLEFKELSLSSPWIEKLGYITANMFNRIAVPTMENKKIPELFGKSVFSKYNIFK